MNKIKIFFLILVLSSLLAAHRVNIFAQVERDSIIGQCYYNDGAPVRQQKVEIFRLSGERLMELQTDSAGNFRFAPPVKEDLKIVLYAGMGHRSETIVAAADLPEMKKPRTEKPKNPQKPVVTDTEESRVDEERLRKIIEDTVEEKFNALRELIVKQQRSTSLITIIGGIGYIFGIFGLLFFFRNRKRQ
jgi:nickel transport protein